MIISVDAGIALDKNPHPFIIRILNELGMEGNDLNRLIHFSLSTLMKCKVYFQSLAGGRM